MRLPGARCSFPRELNGYVLPVYSVLVLSVIKCVQCLLHLLKCHTADLILCIVVDAFTLRWKVGAHRPFGLRNGEYNVIAYNAPFIDRYLLKGQLLQRCLNQLCLNVLVCFYMLLTYSYNEGESFRFILCLNNTCNLRSEILGAMAT